VTRPSSPGGEPGSATLLAYAAPALPLAILTLPFYVLVPAFYAQSLSLPIAAVGQVLLLVRLLDALADPVAGVLADRWRPRLGRRRLWVAAASPFVVLAAWQVFRPGEGAGLAWLGLWASVLSLAWTCIQIPYAAWGAELSPSYTGRVRVTAFREGMTVAGTLLALAAPAILPALGWPGERAALGAFAVAVAIGLPLAVAVLVLRVPEPADLSARRIGWREGLGHVAANRPFLRLAAAFLVNGLANGLPATLFLFFVQRKLQAPDAAGPLLVLYFVCGIAGVPLWLMLARRTSKHRAWCVGMLLACAAFLAAPVLGPGDVALFAAVVVVTGLALGADVILPASIQADVIDVDTAASGEQRAGLYMALWALATKLALASAVGIAFPVLGAMGFDPAAGIETPRGLLTLGLLYAGLPVVLKLGAIALVWRFPIDEAAHDALRARIAARRA
jgi:glycoside/pentoside/hexuronide:cation symporter, GPH family